MKRIMIILTLLITFSLACSLGGLTGGADTARDVKTPVSSTAKAHASWFITDETCQLDETMASSKGSPYAYDGDGNLKELLPDGKLTCILEIQVCGDIIFKQQVINDESEDCPQNLHYSSVPSMEVCCNAWDAAKQSGSPCNPLEDADCDGVINDKDSYPMDFSKQ